MVVQASIKRGNAVNRSANLIIIGFVNFFIFTSALAVVKGSDTAVSVEPSYTFPQVDRDNEMRGFGWFRNGFALGYSTGNCDEDPTESCIETCITSCIFNSVFPISGSVNLNGGRLSLYQDLAFSNPTTLQGFGTIIGNNHLLDLCTSITCLPSNAAGLSNVTLHLHGDLVLSSTIICSGSCTIFGHDYVLDCTCGGLRVASGGTLTIKNVKLNGITNGTIACVDDTSSIILDHVTWMQRGDVTFNTGRILFKNEVDFLGSCTFVYASSKTSTIDSRSQWKIADDMRVSIGKKTINGNEPLYFADATSKLYLDNCNFHVTENGMHLARGKIIVDHDLMLDIASTSTDNGLILGDGTSAGDVVVEIYPGGAARLCSGHLTYDITKPDAIRASSSSARFIRYDNTYYHVKHNIVLTNLLIYAADLSHISLEPGVDLAYDNCLFALDDVEFVAKGARYNGYTVLLGGNDYIYLTRGQLPMYSLVVGAGNKIYGSGLVKGGITLLNSASELIWDVNGSLGNFLSLNGGLLTLNSNLNCMNDVQISGRGTISLGDNKIKFGSSDITWPGSIYWDGDNGIIDISSNVTLSGTWTFSGDCTICGGNQILDLAGGQLVVAQGSRLTLRDMVVRNISGTNVRCLGDSAKIILDNVNWQQSDNFTFTVGSLQFKNSIILKAQPGTIFAYQSSQTSTVLSDSELDLQGGITFSYDPGVASKDCVRFVDESSFLVIEDGSTLHATGTGMTLTNGTLRIKEEGYLSSEVIGALDEGITLGNGNLDDDMTWMVCPSVKVKLLQGSLNYKNVGAASCRIGNVMSMLWLEVGTKLRLYQTLIFEPGIVHFENNTSLARGVDKVLVAGVHVAGTLNFITL
jgi:hypothetical protein